MPDPAPEASPLTKLRRRLPASALGWAQLVAAVASVVVVAAEMAHVLRPLVDHPYGYGRHVWDQTEANRYLVVKSIKTFHQFPFWNPYACGGFPAWGGFENDTNVVSPFLPAYLLLPLQVAMRVEIIASLVVSAAGTWALASRFTRSPAMLAFAVAVFAVSGRLTLQLAAGHMWNLLYALMPWTLFLFDRAVGAEPSLGPARPREAIGMGVLLAMMAYGGAIYPLPQTVVVLGAYAALLALGMRSLRPLGVLAVAGGVAAGLAAPKLLPLLEVMHRYPRILDSPESMTLQQLAEVVLNDDQGFGASHAGIPWHSWHEHGMYVGTVALGVLVAGALLASGRRARALRLVALVLVVFAFGHFSPYAPWALAHRLPLLSSQHVPSRWLYPAALLLACVAGAVVERALARSGRARAWLEVALVGGVAWVAWDVGHVARQPLDMVLQASGPAISERADGFVTEVTLPSSLEYEPGEWSPTALAAEVANVGTIECNMFHGLNNFKGLGTVIPGYEGRPGELGALGRADPGYRGEVYLVEGVGTARFLGWSPNAVDVRVDGARPGDHLVLNQNWDSGWRASGAEAVNLRNTVGAVLTSGSGVVRFRYRPISFVPGLFACAATLVAIAASRRLRRRPGVVTRAK